MTHLPRLFAIPALLLLAAPAVAQDHETHVTLGHDLYSELSHHFTWPSGLTLSARVGAQDGSNATIDFGGAGCMIDGTPCTDENVAGAASAFTDKTLISVAGGVGYQATIDNTELNFSATGSWSHGSFTPGLEMRVTRDDFWVGYVAWHEDISGAVTSSLYEYDLQLGKEGVVRIGIGVKF